MEEGEIQSVMSSIQLIWKPEAGQDFRKPYTGSSLARSSQIAGDPTAELVWFSEQVHNTVESDPFLADAALPCGAAAAAAAGCLSKLRQLHTVQHWC